jgi:hypothetical protein
MVDTCIVTFCDFLGYSRIILNNKGNQSALNSELDKLTSAIDEAEKFIKENSFKYKFFTDNLVLSTQIRAHDKGEGPLGNILGALAMYQLVIASHGYFVRGGIEAGYNFMDERIVFGDALITAHYLESQKAIYPRILVGPELNSLIDEHKKWYGNRTQSMPHNDVLDFASKELFIDYLNGALSYCEDDTNAIHPLVKSHKKHIESNIKKFSNDPDVFPKYEWLRDYHNKFCKRIKAFNQLTI